MKCLNEKCNKEFTPKTKTQSFCCKKCRLAKNQRRFYTSQKKKCPDCGKNIKNTSIRCVACTRHVQDCVGKKTTLGEFHSRMSVKGKHPSWKNSHIRSLARYWNSDKLSLPCSVCGYSKHVELAHIKPISSFPETSTLEEVNHPRNLIQLCPNCHWESHNGFIKI